MQNSHPNVGLGEDLVWVFCGYPRGIYNDLSSARVNCVSQLLPGERTLADDGYQDMNHFIYPAGYPDLAARLKSIAQRHETVNNLCRRWAVLSLPFRHDVAKHRVCFIHHHTNDDSGR
jgi:hypothetical protein